MSAGFRSSSLILQDVRWQLVFLNDAVIPLLTLALGWYVVQVVCGCVAPPWCGMYVWCGMWYVCPLSSYPHHKHPFSDPIPNHILQIGVLRQDHVPWWCWNFSIWATLHGLPLSPNHLASSSQPELDEVPAEQHDDVRLHHSGMPSVAHHRRGVSCQIVDEMGYLLWFDLFDCCLITSVLPAYNSASSNKILGGGVHDPTEVGNFGALLDARAQF